MRRIVLLMSLIASAVIFGSGVVLADSPTTKEDCKNGGYAKYGFKYQGQCIRAVNAASPAVVPPEITLTQAPEWRSVINQDSVTIGWSSNIDQPDYRCDFRMATPIGVETNWIDNNVPCSSPHTYTGLEDGGYDFTIKALDASGNAIATKDVQFIVDTHPPETTIDEAYKAANDPWAITFTATSSEWFSNFQCRVFKANEEPPTQWYNNCDKTITPASFIPSPIEDGNYFLQVRAVDMAQTADPTPIQALFSIDRLAPTIEFTGGPSEGERLSSNDVSISWQSTDFGPSGIRHDIGCLIRITGAGGHEGVGDCKVNSPAEYTDLPDGDYRFSVSTEDRAGNHSEVIERNFTVDTTP